MKGGETSKIITGKYIEAKRHIINSGKLKHIKRR